MKATVLSICFVITCGCIRPVDVRDNLSHHADDIEHIARRYDIGDVDNDQKNDTAYVRFDRDTKTDEIVCRALYCPIMITFNSGIPGIKIDQALGITIRKTADVNQDGANEIIVFSRTPEGWWQRLSVWSLQQGKWDEIAATTAFIAEDTDYENRIVNENNIYYLIGEDKWHEDKNGNWQQLKIKIQ